MTKRQLEEAVEDIFKQLKGPMSDIERDMLVEDRKDFRKMLNIIEQEEGKQHAKT